MQLSIDQLAAEFEQAIESLRSAPMVGITSGPMFEAFVDEVCDAGTALVEAVKAPSTGKK